MIYKLQNAGSLPKWMQKLNSWSIPDSDESAGERILNSTIEQANDASTQEERDQIYKDSAKKNLAITGQSLMMIPMLNEFATYGLLGGGLRLGTGLAGSKAGEYILGKGGDWADKQLGTRFLGTTGRILGGLFAYPIGSSLGYKGALNLAERFPTIARFGSTKRFIGDVVGNALNKSIGKTTFYNIPVYHATDYIGNGNDLRPYGPADAGLHVGTDRSPATDILKTRANKPGTIYEGVYTYTNHTKPYQLDVDPGHTNVFHFGTESQINKLKANSPIWGVNEGSYASIGKTLREQEQNIGRQILMDDGISAIEYPNNVEGIRGNKSIALMNPNSYIFSKNRVFSPKVTISEPYARLSRDGKIINEARSFSIDDDPFNTFQLIKDIEPHQYSVHFKTLGRHALSEPQKQMLFQAVADAIPGGSKLSTWGSVSKGGLAGLKRFEGLGFKPSLQTRTLGLKAQPTQGETLPFGEIVGDKVEVPILYKPRDVVAGSRPISIAEKAGIPKGDRGLFDWNKIELLRPRFNKWADYYGYDKIPESVGLEDAVNIMKNVFKRHNTFFRGVHKPDLPEDVANIENLFGKDYNLDDVYKYVATHGRPGDNAVFISPLSNAGIYGSTGKTAIVRRRFKLGKNPENWLHDADFDITFGGSPEAIKVAQEKNTFTFPWSQRGNGLVENELLAPDGTINFIDFVPQNASTSYFDLNGSLNKYLGYKSFHDVYGFGDYNIFTDVPIEKPKFKQGGKI